MEAFPWKLGYGMAHNKNQQLCANLRNLSSNIKKYSKRMVDCLVVPSTKHVIITWMSFSFVMGSAGTYH